MKKRLNLDWILIGSVVSLAIISLLIIYTFVSSESPNALSVGFFYRQLIAVVLGISAMMFFAFYDYRIFSKFSTRLYFISLALLLAVIIFGKNIRGTTGWLDFMFFNFQPVELVKVVVILFLASFFSKKRTEFGTMGRVAVSLVLVLIPVFLIMQQPDLGSSLIIIFIWIGMMLASKINKKSIFIIFILGVIFSVGGYFLLEDYQVNRLKNFVDPFHDPQGSGYNVIQSMIAIGSGGVMGKGLGHGSQSQLNFLPEKHTDFIFAALAEELGLLGAGLVLFIFLLILYRFWKIAKNSRDNFGYLIAVGAMILIFSQSFINIGMNMGITPVTGVPLPFLSYGGSSIVAMFILVGIVLNVHQKRIKSLD